MNNYNNAYTEVYTILEYLDEEERNKIPSKVLEAIEQSRNTDYIFDLEGDIELREQKLLPETRAILFNLFRDYLAEPWQKEKILKMQQEEREKNELNKKQFYSSNIFEKQQGNKENKAKEEKEMTELVVPSENIFRKIWNFMKGLFD